MGVQRLIKTFNIEDSRGVIIMEISRMYLQKKLDLPQGKIVGVGGQVLGSTDGNYREFTLSHRGNGNLPLS